MFVLLGYKCSLCLAFWDDTQISIFSAFGNSMCKNTFCIVQWLKCIAYDIIAYKMVLSEHFHFSQCFFSMTGRTHETEGGI